MGWAPLCCHAAQLPQSIPQSLKPRAQEHISSSSSGNTEARPWDGNCYYRGDESRDFEGRCFRKMRTAAQTPGHISAKLCCLCAGSDTPQLLTELAVVGLHERLIWERSKG